MSLGFGVYGYGSGSRFMVRGFRKRGLGFTVLSLGCEGLRVYALGSSRWSCRE